LAANQLFLSDDAIADRMVISQLDSSDISDGLQPNQAYAITDNFVIVQTEHGSFTMTASEASSNDQISFVSDAQLVDQIASNNLADNFVGINPDEVGPSILTFPIEEGLNELGGFIPETIDSDPIPNPNQSEELAGLGELGGSEIPQTSLDDLILENPVQDLDLPLVLLSESEPGRIAKESEANLDPEGSANTNIPSVNETLPGTDRPIRNANSDFPPNKSLVDEMNSMPRCTGTDCSEIADRLYASSGGSGKILEVRPNDIGNLNVYENGGLEGEQYYHQVYTDGRYVYDPSLSLHPIPNR
jgi:hypothetical protein